MSIIKPSSREKHYVKVRADHEPDGRVRPLMYKTQEDERVCIDRVLDVRPAASLKTGGQGIRYTCRIGDACVYLFNDQDLWFVEPV